MCVNHSTVKAKYLWTFSIQKLNYCWCSWTFSIQKRNCGCGSFSDTRLITITAAQQQAKYHCWRENKREHPEAEAAEHEYKELVKGNEKCRKAEAPAEQEQQGYKKEQEDAAEPRSVRTHLRQGN